MRIDRIRIGAFGRLRETDTGPEPLDGLVVVLGPNEAGKSTLFTFLTTALYGFRPASREQNPHVPWGSDEASGAIRVKLEDGGCAELERTLRSQPSGRLTVAGRTTDLRNQAAPWVDHVPRTVFRQVFAITLGELAGLDAETWARIQDKVIGSMGAADLRSARAVAEALEREAGEIWRPNRRGNQRLRDLQADLRALRSRRGAAQERDARIRSVVAEREQARLALTDARERRQLDRAEVERVQSLLPVKRQLERVSALRAEGGPREALLALPSDPPARFAELEEEREALARQTEELEAEIGERQDTVTRAAETARTLLTRRDEIVRLVNRVAGSALDRSKVSELRGELSDVEARLDVTAARVLEGSWRDVPSPLLTDVPAELVRERIARARAAPPAPTAQREAAGAGTWVALALGLALLTWGVVAGLTLAAAAGAAALAGAVTLWLATRGGDRARQAPESPDADVATLLERLPLRREHVERPGESLVEELTRLRDLARKREETQRALETTTEHVRTVDAAARDLASALGRDPSADAEVIARELDRDLREAERLEDGARSAQRELARLGRERDKLDARLAILEAERATLSTHAEAFMPGDVARGLRMALERITAHDHADRIDEELRRTHLDLEELRAQIGGLDEAGHVWAVDDEALARARARIEALDEEIEDLITRGEALDGEAARLRDQETVDAVDGEIASLKEKEAQLARERDRKWVLARLLREADRRFREEHQPDLLRRAGSYLEHLTGGRYHRLVVDETDGDHLFHLVGPSLPAPVPLAPPVSTGTLEQAYLSLRLAIVDHLDQSGERLPLFVDEIFVNWDGERRANGLELLAGIARTRQVFVFTCHESVARELERRGARVVELERGG